MFPFRYLDSFITLDVGDLEAAESWYREVLGFRVLLRSEEGAFVHVRRSLGQDVILKRVPGGSDPEPIDGSRFALCLAVDGKLEDIAAHAERQRSTSVRWSTGADGQRELRIGDPDGHQLLLFERITPRAKHAQRVSSAN